MGDGSGVVTHHSRPITHHALTTRPPGKRAHARALREMQERGDGEGTLGASGLSPLGKSIYRKGRKGREGTAGQTVLCDPCDLCGSNPQPTAHSRPTVDLAGRAATCLTPLTARRFR